MFVVWPCSAYFAVKDVLSQSNIVCVSLLLFTPNTRIKCFLYVEVYQFFFFLVCVWEQLIGFFATFGSYDGM